MQRIYDMCEECGYNKPIRNLKPITIENHKVDKVCLQCRRRIIKENGLEKRIQNMMDISKW